LCIALLRFGFKSNPRTGKLTPPSVVWWHVIFAIMLTGAVVRHTLLCPLPGGGGAR
jgi:hypothetical protein